MNIDTKIKDILRVIKEDINSEKLYKDLYDYINIDEEVISDVNQWTGFEKSFSDSLRDPILLKSIRKGCEIYRTRFFRYPSERTIVLMFINGIDINYDIDKNAWFWEIYKWKKAKTNF
jgi:hypothetical protein